MNNKSLIILLVLTVFLVTGCKETHNRAIDIAYQLTATAPDSALSVLNGVNQAKLGKVDMARYAEQDSLYAKCEYYMGKYYMLNDSTELAIDCLQKAANASEKQGDKYTQCLALEKLSKVLGNSNPQKAVFAARKADRIYSSLPNATNINKVYSRLQVSVALLLVDSLNLAEKECAEVIKLARLTEDSSCLSDAYQDMANILNAEKDYEESLWYSCQSYNLSEGKDNTKLLNLSWAYLDTDSIDSCEKLLKRLRTDNLSELYTAYYIRHLAAIKTHDYSNAVTLADSAYLRKSTIHPWLLLNTKKASARGGLICLHGSFL